MRNYQVKSTKNALVWRILTTSLLLSSLAGCASIGNLFGGETVKPVEVVSKPIEKTPLNIAMPDPLTVKPVEWIVVTPENAEEIFGKLRAEGKDVVVLAMTPDGYQRLAITMADVRALIATQRQIIIQYKEYYEPKKAKNGD